MMKRIFVLALVMLFSAALPVLCPAQELDAEALSRMSQGIAEWKLMEEEKPKQYMRSDLIDEVIMGDGQGQEVVSGLMGFDDYYIKEITFQGAMKQIWSLHPSMYQTGKNVMTWKDDMYRMDRAAKQGDLQKFHNETAHTFHMHPGVAMMKLNKSLDFYNKNLMTGANAGLNRGGINDAMRIDRRPPMIERINFDAQRIWRETGVMKTNTIQMPSGHTFSQKSVDWNKTLRNSRDRSILSNPHAWDKQIKPMAIPPSQIKIHQIQTPAQYKINVPPSKPYIPPTIKHKY